MNKLVTIGIPTYNRLQFLKEAVASALAQSYPNIELIISQNPHKDESLTRSISDWCEEIVDQNPKIRYQLNPHNIGGSANINAIADAARGEYLACIGDDDRLLPDFVEKLLNVIQSDTALAFSNHYFINVDGKRLEEESYQCTKHFRRDNLAAGVIDAEAAAWQNAIPHFASLIRTQDFQQLRFREDIKTPDLEFYIRLAQKGCRFVFVPEYLSEIRLHPQTATAAGQHPEELLPYLTSVPVSSKIESYKRELLSGLTIYAASSSLLHRNVEQAREYIRSEYYPRRSFKGLFQKLCTMLPADFGYKLYKIIYLTKNYKTHFIEKDVSEYSFIQDGSTKTL